MGPGVVTGAADDDPSAIVTYSQAGAQLGFGMLWMVLLMLPLMYTMQEMSGRIGLVTGSGLGKIIKDKYSIKVLLPLASLLFISNIITIGADIGAMAASLRLLVPQIPISMAVLGFAILILISQIFISYNTFIKVLKYTALSLFAYVITSIIVGGNIQNILFSTFVPHIELSKNYAVMFAAIFGTTISPYLFFWQASAEVEEEVKFGKIKDIGKGRPKQIGKKEIKIMKIDTAIGMGFSQVIMWSIMVTCAGSLYSHGVTNIQTTEQAAKSLEPLVNSFPYSGIMSKFIFALGIIGAGILGIPALSGSCGYVLSDAFGWNQGLNKKFNQARSFYLVIAISGIIGIFINFIGINPIQALIYSSIINGIVSLPMIVFVIKIANDKSILKDAINSKKSNIIGWITVAINLISVIVMFFTIFQ